MTRSRRPWADIALYGRRRSHIEMAENEGCIGAELLTDAVKAWLNDDMPPRTPGWSGMNDKTKADADSLKQAKLQTDIVVARFQLVSHGRSQDQYP